MEKYIHIDKIWKDSGKFDSSKPPGSKLWDFIMESDPNFERKFLKKYEDGPESVFLNLTKDCNSKCEFCDIHNEPENDIFDLIKNVISLKSKYVIVNGGDPFLRENFIQAIQILAKNVRVSITTSSRIDIKTLKILRDLNIAKLQFPLDGISTHNKIHKNRSFEDIVQSIKNCNKVGIYTNVITNITKDTISEIPNVIKLCEKLAVGQFSFFRFPICGVVNDCYSKNFIEREDYKKINKFLFEKRGKVKTHITSNDAMWKGCSAALTSCEIGLKGNVYPCRFLRICGGNILKNKFNKIWNSKTFKKLRNRENLEGKCGTCKYKFFCGGCRGVPFNKSRNPFGEDFGCWIRE